MLATATENIILLKVIKINSFLSEHLLQLETSEPIPGPDTDLAKQKMSIMKCNSNKISQTTSECEKLVYSGPKNFQTYHYLNLLRVFS